MADDDDEKKVDATENKGGGMKIAVIVLAVLLLVGVSIGVTVFMLGGKAEGVEEQVEVEVVEITVKPLYFNFDPPFVVNFADDDHIRFLQVVIEVMTFDETVIADIESYMPLFRNNMILLLSNVEYSKINNSAGINALRMEALIEMQNILEEKTGRKGIEELYFTNFVMQ